ncbi:MAG: hypothetical protein JSS32_10975 [Verrucomicrobia bacterium]|nr:hypothetical protein [Verrucomicrobiota bacterium]
MNSVTFKSFDELFKALDVSRGNYSKFTMPDGSKPTITKIVSCIGKSLSALADAKGIVDQGIQSKLLEKYKAMLPKGYVASKNQEAIQSCLFLKTAITKAAELQKTKQALEQIKGDLKKQKKEVLPGIQKKKDDLIKYNEFTNFCRNKVSSFAEKAKFFDETIQEITRSLDQVPEDEYNLYLKLVGKLIVLLKICKMTDPKKEFVHFYRKNLELMEFVRNNPMREGSLCAYKRDYLLGFVQMSLISGFVNHYFDKQETFLEGFYERHDLFANWENKEATLQKALNAYFSEISPDIQKVEVESKKEPLVESKKQVEISVEEPEVEEEVFEEPKVETEFPYEYDPRVLMWLNDSLSEEDLVHLESYQKDRTYFLRQLLYHGFSRAVDQFYDCGKEAVWKNNTTGLDDTLFIVPAEIDTANGIIRGAMHYCISALDGKCYHRMFKPMSMIEVIQTFERNVFYDDDFPDLLRDVEPKKPSKVEPPQEDFKEKEDSVRMSPDGSYAIVFDARLDMKIKITILKG